MFFVLFPKGFYALHPPPRGYHSPSSADPHAAGPLWSPVARLCLRLPREEPGLGQHAAQPAVTHGMGLKLALELPVSRCWRLPGGGSLPWGQIQSLGFNVMAEELGIYDLRPPKAAQP